MVIYQNSSKSDNNLQLQHSMSQEVAKEFGLTKTDLCLFLKNGLLKDDYESRVDANIKSLHPIIILLAGIFISCTIVVALIISLIIRKNKSLCKKVFDWLGINDSNQTRDLDYNPRALTDFMRFHYVMNQAKIASDSKYDCNDSNNSNNKPLDKGVI